MSVPSAERGIGSPSGVQNLSASPKEPKNFIRKLWPFLAGSPEWKLNPLNPQKNPLFPRIVRFLFRSGDLYNPKPISSLP